MANQRAAGTNRRFEHTESTSASRGDVWDLWTDVSSWKHWDQGLADATIDQPFEQGAEGTIIPKAGRPASFVVTEMEPDVSYTFVTKLPGAGLRIRRDFVDGPTTSFRHSVAFDGPASVLWATLLGRSFRKQLPSSMRLLAAEADRRASS